MTKVHNGIEYKGGEQVWVQGHASNRGQLIGVVEGFTKSGQFKVRVTDGWCVGKVVRSHWVSPC